MSGTQDAPIVEGGASFLYPGDEIGCLLLHGFTAMPAEVRDLGDALHGSGRTVFGLRMPGHGTHPQHLAETRWHHHVAAAADAVALLRGRCERVCAIGTSMGAVVALSPELAGVDAIVALSTPGGIEPLPITTPTGLTPKDVPLDQRYGIRRERDYPAYGATPEDHHAELHLGFARMWAHLPDVTCPVLLVHSDADDFFPVSCMTAAADRLAAAPVETHVVHGLGHGMLLDPRREAVFVLVDDFVERLRHR